MKIRWFDRLLITLSALLLLALGALLVMTGIRVPEAVYAFGIKLIQAFLGLKAVHWVRSGAWYSIAALILGGALIIAWGLRLLSSLLPKRERRTVFNASRLEHGNLSIALQALEHLVTKCVADHPEFTDARIRISGDDEKAAVTIRAALLSGVSMPKATAELQQQIVSYLSECAGIPVSGVHVIVEDTRHNPALPPPVPALAIAAPPIIPVTAIDEPAIDTTVESVPEPRLETAEHADEGDSEMPEIADETADIIPLERELIEEADQEEKGETGETGETGDE